MPTKRLFFSALVVLVVAATLFSSVSAATTVRNGISFTYPVYPASSPLISCAPDLEISLADLPEGADVQVQFATVASPGAGPVMLAPLTFNDVVGGSLVVAVPYPPLAEWTVLNAETGVRSIGMTAFVLVTDAQGVMTKFNAKPWWVICKPDQPTKTPTTTPTHTPTNTVTNTPTDTPTNTPTNTPTDTPTNTPTNTVTNTPTDTPTNTPTNTPTDTPTNTPTFTPTATFTPTSPAFAGCTPGYWRQEQHFDSWSGYSPTDDFEAVFGVDASFSPTDLLTAVWLGGGGEEALARHAVAALLNSSSIDYPLSAAQIIAGVQAAYASGDFETFKDTLDYYNNLGCPLN